MIRLLKTLCIALTVLLLCRTTVRVRDNRAIPICLEGTVEVVNVDYSGYFEKENYLATANGRYRLVFPSMMQENDYRSGDTLNVEGILQAPYELAVTTQLGYGPRQQLYKTTGAQRLLVLLVTFPDISRPGLEIIQARDLVFEEVNSFYRNASYGQMSLTGDVYGYYRVARPYQSCEPYQGTFIKELLNLARERNAIDFHSYDGILVFGSFGIDCQWAGAAFVGTTVVETPDGAFQYMLMFVNLSLTEQPTRPERISTFRTTAHELGHGLGAYHADLLTYGNGEELFSTVGWVRYPCADPFDIMGCTGRGEFNGLLRESFGWIPLNLIRAATQSGRYRLAPLEGITESNGLKFLIIPRSVEQGPDMFRVHGIALEYRQPIGSDRTLPDNIFDGALVHIPLGLEVLNPLVRQIDPWQTMLVDPYVPPTNNSMDLALLPGVVMHDPITDARFEVVESLRDKENPERSRLTIQVQIDPGIDFTPPEVMLRAPSNGDILSLPFELKAHAEDASGIWGVLMHLRWFWCEDHSPESRCFYERRYLAYADQKQPGVYRAQISATYPGYYKAFAKAYDKAGQHFNIGISQRVRFWVKD